MSEKNLADLEVLLLSIKNENVRSYAREAIECYYAGAYRASILSIWIALVLDLYKKSEYLSEDFNDAAAKEIIEEIDKIRKNNNGRASVWEGEILRRCLNHLKIIDKIQYDKLDNIRKDRNLCAHPVLDEEGKLYQPTPEEARSHIVNAIKLVLSQNAILGKNFSEKILEIIENSYLDSDKEAILKRIKSKYLETADENLRKQLIKFILKLLTCIDVDKASQFSEKYINTLIILFEYKPRDFELIKEDIIRILEKTDAEHINYIIELIYNIPLFGELLTDSLKEQIKAFVASAGIFRLKSKIKLLPYIEDYYEEIFSRFSELSYENQNLFICMCKKYGKTSTTEFDSMIKNILTRVVEADRWNDANKYFQNMIILLNEDLINSEHITFLLSEAPKNRGSFPFTENNQLSESEYYFTYLFDYSQAKYPDLLSNWKVFIIDAFENQMMFERLKEQIDDL